jgi:lysylphosphatidylglycerol synthetase-like protein (DUF2156 family)
LSFDAGYDQGCRIGGQVAMGQTSLEMTGSFMSNIRTANKRHARAQVLTQTREKAAKSASMAEKPAKASKR